MSNKIKIDNLLKKYPDRIPVITSSKSIKDKCENKFVVPLNMTAAEFILMFRKKVTLDSTESIFLFIKDTKNNSDVIVQSSTTFESLYNLYKDSDNILNIIIEKEAVFG